MRSEGQYFIEDAGPLWLMTTSAALGLAKPSLLSLFLSGMAALRDSCGLAIRLWAARVCKM